MNQNRASVRFRIIIFVLTICMTAFAFIHSSMPASVSDEESKSVLDFLYEFVAKFGIILTDHIVRKAAHFTEYTAIGALLLSCAYSFDRIKPQKYYSQVLSAGLAIPLCDETIQLNVEGRSGQISDVLLDFSGVLTGAVIMFLIYAIYRKIKNIT